MRMDSSANPKIRGGVRQALTHDSAAKHVSGGAIYIDDMPEERGLLHLAFGKSEIANGKIVSMDLSQVRSSPGVELVLTADDIPGKNDVSPIAGDDLLFADKELSFVGQSLFVVAARERDLALKAAQRAEIVYASGEPALTIARASERGSVLEDPQVMERGNAPAALQHASHRLAGKLCIGGQDHFYLEGQVCHAIPDEDGGVLVHSSTQNPSEVQEIIARVLSIPSHAVAVEVRRMGGGFGGKETQPALLAAAAALVAVKAKRPARFRLDRDDDMIMTGKRHDFEAAYDVAFDESGSLMAADITLSSRCGCSADLSLAVNDRAMFHSDNAYYIPDVRITSHRFKTNTVSNTAFRGFGGPQGMMVIERIMDEIAMYLELDPIEVRRANFYGKSPRDVTPYHQKVEENVIGQIVQELTTSSDYVHRRDEIKAYNSENAFTKKGIALTPVKFGISFTARHLNQAGALIHLYKDGSVYLNHGGTEMGQGLFIKVAQVVAEEFQIDIDKIKISSTTTDKVPNSSPTAASAGSDLNGMAARDAATTLKARLIAFAAEKYDCAADLISFNDNQVLIGNNAVPFERLVEEAYFERVSLSATGFYRTPKIHYDRDTHSGHPFYYFGYGAAVSEVIIDTLTGEHRVLRTDILHDVGKSLNPAIDLGQIEGGFVQGMGWLTTEELYWDDRGELMTHAPSTYKIPVCSDRPAVFNMALWSKGRNPEETIYRSKAVGEPPLMLAISVFSALTDAVASVGAHRKMPMLDAPATPERVLMAVEEMRSLAAEAS